MLVTSGIKLDRAGRSRNATRRGFSWGLGIAILVVLEGEASINFINAVRVRKIVPNCSVDEQFADTAFETSQICPPN